MLWWGWVQEEEEEEDGVWGTVTTHEPSRESRELSPESRSLCRQVAEVLLP